MTSKRERKRSAALAVIERQNQVGLSIIGGPIMPAFQLSRGTPAVEVAATTIAAGLETWLFYQYIGETATFIEKEALKKVAMRAMMPSLVMGAAIPLGIMAAKQSHSSSTLLQKTATLGGVPSGSTQKRRMQSLGGL